jgi:hypothetical protein
VTDNLKIWNALAKTDPAHTKQFSRSGGFKGTALKPIWIVKMLTEQFGPAGQGWGTNEPRFEVVACGDEVLVYCTVSGWHGDRSNVVWGVGGDKVQAKRKDGHFYDDEAFKKAHTDAIGNAFKMIGVGADIHMGQFDDDKYVATMREEFAEPVALIDDAQWAEIVALIDNTQSDSTAFCRHYGIMSVRDLPANSFADARNLLSRKLKKAA